MGNVKLNKTKLDGVYIIEPKVFFDERGYFMEVYNEKDFSEAELNIKFVQEYNTIQYTPIIAGFVNWLNLF